MTEPKPLWVARFAGTQAEIGAQHGRAAAGDAAKLFEFYRSLPERALAGGARGIEGVVMRAVVRAATYAIQSRMVRGRPREATERGRAYAEAVLAENPGVGTVDAALRATAAMDTLQNCVALAARGAVGPFARPLTALATAAAIPACSTAIAWGSATADGELVFARNFDFPGVGVWDAAPAFVLCAPTGGQHYGFFTTRGADTPVVTVVNEAGLVFAPHTRWHRGVTFGGAMIVDLVHELARRAESLDDAIAIARELRTASSWGIAIGSAREKSALSIELAGPHLEVVRPPAGATTFVCTNRYRSPAMIAQQFAGSAAWAIHSERREARLRALVDARKAPLRPRDLVRMLGDRRDVAAPDRERHLGAILAQPTNVHCCAITPSKREALVGIDRAPCCEGAWAELAWTWDGPTGTWELPALDPASGFRGKRTDDAVAPHDAATRHVHEAARVYEGTHDTAAARAALDRAIAVDPDDPSLRISAAWLAIEDGAYDRALVHVHAGLARETEPYRRGQLLLWGARAARRDDPSLARRWTDELARLGGPGVDELAAESRRRWSGKVRVNLAMVDAY